MINQDWEGKQLDKDIKFTGNKVYSPETCIFVPQQINSLLTDRRAERGSESQGVHFNIRDNKFQANCSVNGRKKHLGYFDKEEDAAVAYKEFKSKHVHGVAMEQADPLRTYLIRISREYLV